MSDGSAGAGGSAPPPRPDGYVPALDYDWLTPAYDALIRLTLPERVFKWRLIEQAAIQATHSVLDLGCGTATLTIMAKRAHPSATVVGLDGDPKILAIAARKVNETGLEIPLREGLAFDLPFPDGSFDRVLSSLVFHHLTSEDKRRTLAECLRVLRPRGELHIADWGKPRSALMWLASWSVRLIEGSPMTADNVKGLLPDLLQDARFVDVAETAHFPTVFGPLSLLRGTKT